MTRRKGLLLFVLTIFFVATAPLFALDFKQLARDLAERISALPNVTAPINLMSQEDGTASAAELRELRHLVAEELKTLGIRVSQRPGALPISLSFSESLRGRLLVAEIRRGDAPEAIILLAPTDSSTRASVRRVSMQRSLVWRQDKPILDFVLLPGKTLILSPGKVSLIQNEGRGWTEQSNWDLTSVEALPRDPRGRLLLTGSEFRAYLPRHECHAAIEPGSSIACDPSGRGWPVIPADPSEIRVRLSAGRNYFDQLRTANGAAANVPAFYSAAVLNSENGPVWAVTNLDGETRFYDSRPAEIGRARGWGTELCPSGQGW